MKPYAVSYRSQTKKRFRRTVLASLISAGVAVQAQASFVRSDIDYQYFRDFAENKGKFTPGARNIEVFDKNGQLLGKMMTAAPMPDLSGVSTSGVATLVSPQYVTSVQHNGGYGSVRFGQAGDSADAHHFDYKLVDRNDYPTVKEQTDAGVDAKRQLHQDYHTPRLAKLVTEVAPIPMSSAGMEPRTYEDKERFPVFARTGSGTQWTRDKDGTNRYLSGPYRYLTGGSPLRPSQSRYSWFDAQSSVYDDTYGPMATYGAPGDSGSPVLVYDKQQNRWVTLAVLNFYLGDKGQKNISAISRPEFLLKQQNEDIGANISNSVDNAVFDWTAAGNASTVSNPANTGAPYRVGLTDEAQKANDTSQKRPSLNHGKSMIFAGKRGTLRLQSDINQGAGALKFDTDFTVTGKDAHTTWLGAGVDIAKGKTVQWQVHNPNGDRLSKIGEGVLRVNGQGKNQGSISVGDGTVILAQRADANGEKQAFSSMGIVSGRATVVLESADQVNPDNIYFGFRGGRLDVNGNDLTFNRIQNADKGAHIVNNHRTGSAEITISRRLPKPMTAGEIPWLNWNQKGNGLREYVNTHRRNRKDYFILKPGGNPGDYYPVDGKSSASWEFLGHDRAAAERIYLERENARRHVAVMDGYHGYLGERKGSGKHNGKLNLIYRAENPEDLTLFSGGMNLNGNVSVQSGKVLLSGAPVLHARDMQKNADVVREDEWTDSNFTAHNFVVEGKGVLQTGRNLPELRGNVSVSGSGQAVIGYIQGETPVCVRSDYTGETACAPGNISKAVLDNMTPTRVEGNLAVREHGQLTLGNGVEYRRAIAAERQTGLRLAGAHWHLPDNSRIGSLSGSHGGQITLSNGNPYRTLTVDGDLSGEMSFNLNTNLAANQGDKIVVNGLATGNHTLNVRNSGSEPTQVQRLTLLALNHGAQDKNVVTVNLRNPQNESHVDAGAWRYTLASDERNQYYLHNPVKEAELAKAKADAEKAAAAAAAKKLADAQAARKQAEALAAQAESARLIAVAAQTAAEEAKRRAEENQNANAAALQTAREAAETAQRQAQAAESAKAEAERQRDAANTAKVEAEQRLQAAQNNAQAAQAEKTVAEREAQTAKAAAQAAEVAKADAEKRLQAAEAAKAEAEEAKRAAEAAKLLAEQNQGADAAAVAAAQSRAEAAEKTAKEAEKRAQAAESAKAQAQNDLTAAQSAVSEARAAAQAAQQRAQEQADAAAAATERAQTAESAKADAEKRLQAAESAKAEAEAARRVAEEAKRLAEQSQGADAAAVAAAQSRAEAAEKTAQAAEKRAQAAESAKTQAQNDLTAAQSAVSEARAAAQSAQQRAQEQADAAAAASERARSAEAAKADVEKRLQAAEAAKAEAEKAKRDAEEAKRLAEASHGEAVVAASRRADAAEQAAQEAQKRAEAAEADKTKAQSDLAEAQNAVETAREAERLAVERANAQADAAAAATERAQSAESAKADAEKRLQAAEAAKQRLEEAESATAAALADTRRTLAATESRLNQAERDKQNAQSEAARQAQSAEDAKAAQALAEQQAQAAETARLAAESAKTAAEAAAKTAQEAQAAAEAAQNGSQQQLQNALSELANARTAAENAEARRELAENHARAAQTAADEAKRLQANEKQAREQAQAAAETAQNAAREAENAAAAARRAQQHAESLSSAAQSERDAALAQAKAAQENAAAKASEAEAAQKRAEAAEAARVQSAAELKEAQARYQAEAAAREKAEADLKAAQLARAEEAAERQAAQAQAAAAKRQAEAEAARRQSEQAANQAQAQLISRNANTALSELSAQSSALEHSVRGVERRLRQIGKTHNGIWSAAETRKGEQRSAQYRPYEYRDDSIHLGIDRHQRIGVGELTAGAVFSHTRSNRDYAESVDGRGHATTVGVYGKAQFDNGVFATAQAGYGRSRSQISSSGKQNEIKRNIAHASAGIGTQIQVGGLDVRPDIGVNYRHIGATDYRLHDGDTDGALHVQSGSQNLVGYQAGLSVSKTMKTANGVQITPHVRAAYHDLDREANVNINGRQLKQRFGKYWEGEAGVGVAAGAWNVSAQVSHSRGNERRRTTSGGVSVGYRW
ncbi:S6 family peptidase [Conchiformibius steedae]|uniref:Autotransporter domain-containing protein n=1 Tax=Conchiformibius steedae TaxID=153493 RepID=A0A3P2AAK8_9NEIS|nr:S6 family peptidase [Conchiformibius steedae]RRD91280.1 autotransporter domain-containing protein [Conchiformibius steedae]